MKHSNDVIAIKPSQIEEAILRMGSTLSNIRTKQHCDTIKDNILERQDDMQAVTAQAFAVLRALSDDIYANESRLDKSEILDDIERDLTSTIQDIEIELHELESA